MVPVFAIKKNLVSFMTLISTICVSAQKDFKTILTTTEKNVIPEGITINPVDGMIYVSSIALKKIIAIDSNGMHRDFITSGQDEFLEGLGMKINAKKQWLWAVSNQKQGKWFISQLHAFDLKTGSIKQKYVVKDTMRHLFNDLILHPNGKIYITDSEGWSIYEADPRMQKLRLLIRDSLIAYPNGITCNNKGKVYVATYSTGLIQLDLQSKRLARLNGYLDSAKAHNLDGLIYWNNKIIGVYNGAETNADNAIVEYSLNARGDQVTGERIIDTGNNFFHEPTTAALYANKLYVLANSYLAAYNANKESVKGIENKLGSVTILVYNLK
jgi:DNA-binding beta-propeller fold protein YncE